MRVRCLGPQYIQAIASEYRALKLTDQPGKKKKQGNIWNATLPST
jgi:hypothetical protein